MCDNNFDTQRQLEHLEYEMNRTLFVDCQDTFFCIINAKFAQLCRLFTCFVTARISYILGPHFLC
jgi:hypothetical protein